jgi:hypothetical protein
MRTFATIVIYFSTLSVWAAGAAFDCADANPKNAASISIGFDYEGTNREIPDMIPKLDNTAQDAVFYAGFSKFTSGAESFYRDREVRSPLNGGKKGLLDSIVKDVGSARYVNVNFSGHGVVMPNGEWGILLPNVPRGFLLKCVQQVDVGRAGTKGLRFRDIKSTGFTKNCEGFNDYFLTGSDLQRALPGRKFFAAIDTCNAGAANFGPESVALASSLSGEVAGDGTGKNGVFTEQIGKLFDDCASDVNQNNHLDLDEVLSHFINITNVRVDTKRNLRGTEGKITTLNQNSDFQHPGIVATKNLPWTACFQLRHMPAKCGFHDGGEEDGAVPRK